MNLDELLASLKQMSSNGLPPAPQVRNQYNLTPESITRNNYRGMRGPTAVDPQYQAYLNSQATPQAPVNRGSAQEQNYLAGLLAAESRNPPAGSYQEPQNNLWNKFSNSMSPANYKGADYFMADPTFQRNR